MKTGFRCALIGLFFFLSFSNISLSAPLGDTLTVIQRPILNIPAIVRPGDTLKIECEAAGGAGGWAAALARGSVTIPLPIIESSYDASTLWWEIDALVPDVRTYELYDLIVRSTSLVDTARHAVKIIPEFKTDYYFIHITDTHLPTHLYYFENGAATDTSEIADLREVIKDINIINPEFVLITGDLVNEGELEDYLSRRYFSRAQHLLQEFQLPIYLTSGNHDIGGWGATPPPDGTARKNWWKFFGWKRLNNPPQGAPYYTQDYTFNYGKVHYVGLEAYINYDGWRSQIYGSQSFTTGQMQWLVADLSQSSAPTKVLFYHRDFSHQINLSRLGADMALSGHIHRDVDDFTPPYDIATNNVCDGERSYRLIRVSDGELQPARTISAGTDGRNLDVRYEPSNDGSNYVVTALISNRFNQRFENAMLRFSMPNEGGIKTVEGGDLFQIETNGEYATWYVNVDIHPTSEQKVIARLDVVPSTPPSVTVVQPNGGEQWSVGSRHEIVWNAEDDQGIESLDILLSGDGGLSFADTIASGQPDSGSFLWTVSPLSTSQARIKIVAHDVEGKTGEDISDNNFSILDITPPAVTLYEPQGGEIWAIDSIYTITWSASDDVDVTAITILLSRDGALSFPETLVTNETNDGTYDWKVCGEPTRHARVMIIASDESGNASSDMSLSDFEIYDSSAPGSEIPSGVIIRASAPNPFDQTLVIDFGIPSDGQVDISLLDVRGRRVSRVVERTYTAGYHRIVWTPQGNLKPGIYWLVVEMGDRVAACKIVRLRT